MNMKKAYHKPALAFEGFQLSCAIAGDCNLKLNHYSYECTADENGLPNGPNSEGEFFDYSKCQTDLTGPELDGGETVCYHGPVYTMGMVFLAS